MKKNESIVRMIERVYGVDLMDAISAFMGNKKRINDFDYMSIMLEFYGILLLDLLSGSLG